MSFEGATDRLWFARLEERSMAREQAVPIREALRKLFPTAFLVALARSSGAVKRLRQVDPGALFWTVVLGFGVGKERTLASLRRAYEKTTGKRIEESSFYDRFNPGFAAMLKSAADHALKSLVGVGRTLRGPLEGFRDVLLTDSTVIRLHDMLARQFPACRTNHTKAALKAHTILSVTGAGKGSVKITGERAHDGPVFKVGAWVRDRLLLFDLGYFRYQLFASITRNGGYFLTRLKANANPTITALHRVHRGRALPVVGEKLRDVGGRLLREILDVEVDVRFKRRVYAGRIRHDVQSLRVVGIRDSGTGEHHFYVTNIPVEKLAAEDIRATYALRWQIELLFKELKHHYRIDQMPSSNRNVVEALLYASILTLVVSRRLLDVVRRTLADVRERIPMQRWAALLEALAGDLLHIVTRPPRELGSLLRRVASTLLHEAVDPNAERPGLLGAVEARSHAYRPR
jgi:IS4 transposase